MAIVVQLLTRNNQVTKQFIVDKTEVSIGRSFNNDIVLSDPYISPHHIFVGFNEESELSVVDRHSDNGTLVNRQPLIDAKTIGVEDVLTLGKTRLRILPSDYQVPATLPLSPLEEITHPLSFKTTVTAMVAVFVALILSGQYLSSIEEFSLFKQVPGILGMIFLVAVWAMLFSLSARLRKHEAKVCSQLSITFFFVSLLIIFSKVETWLNFNFGDVSGLFWIDNLLFAAILACLFWFNLFFSNNQSHRTKTIIAATMSISLVSLLHLFAQNAAADFSSRPQYNNIILPPSFLVRAPISTSEYRLQLDQVFDQAQQELSKEKQQNQGDDVDKQAEQPAEINEQTTQPQGELTEP